jgi:hypothetical protein
MDDYIDDIDRINVVGRLIRREQVIREVNKCTMCTGSCTIIFVN